MQTAWPSGGPGNLATADQTMDLEQSDRVARFDRLASSAGVLPPTVEQALVPREAIAGALRPIPVVRVVFDERAFFDVGSDVPRLEAARVLSVVAENMRRDVPDVRLTLLGHTDATGTAASNDELSQRRAVAVFRRLIAAGVNPAQLGTVAIGSAQPIAPNATPGGRARNRRVEFLISGSEAANLALVEYRPVNPAFLGFASAHAVVVRHRVAFLKPVYTGPADFSEAPADRKFALAAVKTIDVGTAKEDPIVRSSATVP